jgi:hypothetical protein
MTKISKLIFLFCLLFSSASGQTQNIILTREQNNKWLDSLKKLPLEKQLFTLSDRLLSDTNVFVRQYYADRIRVDDALGNRVYGDGKPTLIIGGYAMIIDNKTQTHKIVDLTKLLTGTYINELNILSPNDPATTALYGSPGQFGIIVMTVTKKKYAKLFKRLQLKSNY